MLAQAEARAAQRNEKQAAEDAAARAALRSQAESRMAQAAAVIVGRIVKR